MDLIDVKKKLQKVLAEIVLTEFGVEVRFESILIEIPSAWQFGDLSTNIALVLSSKLKESGKTPAKDINPNQLALQISSVLQNQRLSFIDKAEVKNNFINVWLKNDFFINSLGEVIKKGEDYSRGDLGEGKTLMVEFAHPNTHKMFHIGHLRNISLGESLVRILEFNGFKVIRGNYQGDVGMHIAKCLWGVLNCFDFDKEVKGLKTVKDKVKFLGLAYVKGSSVYKDDKKVQGEVKDINYLIYASAQKYQKEEKGKEPSSTDYLSFVKGKQSKIDLEKIYSLWKLTRKWSLDYFNAVYDRVYTYFDRFYFESECLSGVDIAKKALKLGILKKSQGAVVFPGEKYGLDTRVFINSLGLPTYEGKELGLANIQFSEFDLDKIIHVVTPEQASFFQATFKVEELLDPDKFKDKQYHLSYGWVKLKKGKMSSRLGNVIGGEELLDEAKKKIKADFSDLDEETLEKIALGAVKYSFLKVKPGLDIIFDFDESISLQGNSGPYLQYTYTRCRSVLEKAENIKTTNFPLDVKLNKQEQAVLKLIPRFKEVVWEAGKDYAPNLIAGFLYELAQSYNAFYHNNRILDEKNDKKTKQFRLLLTKGVLSILKTGLYLLGIKAPEKM
jgi:arginyl-tRNA synthetase